MSIKRNRILALIIIVEAMLIIWLLCGCTMPKTVNFAPLIDLNVKDSANGNTVTPVAP